MIYITIISLIHVILSLRIEVGVACVAVFSVSFQASGSRGAVSFQASGSRARARGRR